MSPNYGSGESGTGVTYLYMTIHPKSCRISPLQVAESLLIDSKKGAVGV